VLVTRPKPLRFTLHAGRLLWHICATALAVALVVGTFTPPTSAQEEGEGNGNGETPVPISEALSHLRKRDVHAQVVGGSPVAQGSLTFVTFIAVDVGGGNFFNCGGSLITPRLVLTAAHCVEHPLDETPFAPSQFTLGIGHVDVDVLTEANLFGVTAVSQHPGWDPATFANDVAVLELDEAVPSSLAKPIALIASGNTSLDNAGRAVTVAGWGLTAGGGEPSRDLLKADLNVVSDATCDDTFSSPVDFAGVICAGAPAKSSCNGDSGGALFATVTTKAGGKSNRAKAQKQHEIKAEKKHKKHKKKKHKKKKTTTVTQIGVASFAIIGCPPGLAGGYAQLSAPAIHDFIDDVLAS
jgi:hypothetical protein